MQNRFCAVWSNFVNRSAPERPTGKGTAVDGGAIKVSGAVGNQPTPWQVAIGFRERMEDCFRTIRTDLKNDAAAGVQAT